MLIKRTLLAVAAFATLGSAFAGDADFTLVNRTGYPIKEVYLSASKAANWGNDRLGDNILNNGASKLFRFSDKASCKQDMQVVFDDDGSEVVWEGFNLCEINKVTLKLNRAAKTVSADIE
ncbi:MAG: hypothetical protein V4573_13965 [Pseudomonadota bacterium]